MSRGCFAPSSSPSIDPSSSSRSSSRPFPTQTNRVRLPSLSPPYLRLLSSFPPFGCYSELSQGVMSGDNAKPLTNSKVGIRSSTSDQITNLTFLFLFQSPGSPHLRSQDDERSTSCLVGRYHAGRRQEGRSTRFVSTRLLPHKTRSPLHFRSPSLTLLLLLRFKVIKVWGIHTHAEVRHCLDSFSVSVRG